ncbi:putative Uncharacterized 50.6 kDa protein in the 5\\'region of gyrA and gyrB [Actinacidiphila cocklensis]|uniref:Uncharacterized 50.6 kDa protein in the 5\'region of gyrA and gyrB n=1 Tax=Actinacidiphila cocklensis TaxID=887465 RepID=A0A9W4E1D4_9ACTN|nr:putative Uncharacterized 50.6 kDa protein in the 5\\'region of gyrA and gyrB [Actinacidiphila cocklensis]
MRAPAGAQPQQGRGGHLPGDPVLLPALPAAAAAGRLRHADAAVDRPVAAPQQEVPHPDHPRRRDRRGHQGQGVRGAHADGRDRQRGLRPHRAGPRQHHPHLRHPRPGGARPRDEDPRRGRLPARPRDRAARPRRRLARRGRAGLPAAVRRRRRRLRRHRDRGLPPAADHHRAAPLPAARPQADQVAPHRHRTAADAGAGREAREERAEDPHRPGRGDLPRGVDRQGKRGGGHLHRRPGGALPHPDLDRGCRGEPADRHPRRGDRTRPARRDRGDDAAGRRRGLRARRRRGRTRPGQGRGGRGLPAHRAARHAAGQEGRRQRHRGDPQPAAAALPAQGPGPGRRPRRPGCGLQAVRHRDARHARPGRRPRLPLVGAAHERRQDPGDDQLAAPRRGQRRLRAHRLPVPQARHTGRLRVHRRVSVARGAAQAGRRRDGAQLLTAQD